MRIATTLLCGLLVLGVFAPGAARALPRPDLDFTAGTTLAATGAPNSGGLSVSASPLWPIDERFSFGVTVFADDIGTSVSDLRDPNNGTYLGIVPTSHRWTYGGAWRADANVYSHKRWDADAVGEWGYYRVEDDQRGALTGAASALGFTLGANLRHAGAGPQGFGLAARYHRFFTDKHAAFGGTGRYVTLALEWRWAGTAEQ